MLAFLAERDYLVHVPQSTIAGESEWCFGQGAERILLAASVDAEIMRRRKRFAAQWIEARAARQPTSERFELVAKLYDDGGDAARAGRSFIIAADEARQRLRYERARSLYLRGIRMLDLDDSVLKLEGYHKLGDVAARLGRGREALAHFGEMLRIAWRMDLPAKGGAAHARVGRLHRTMGDYKRALHHLDLAQVLFGLAGDRVGRAATFDDIGRVRFLTGELAEALRCHHAALALREELGDERGKALTLSGMGLVRTLAGDLSGAHQHFRRALDISRAVRDPRGVALSLLDLGVIEREAGHPDRALEFLEEARRLARDWAEKLSECQIGIQIGDCLRIVGRLTDAERELRTAKDIARKFAAKRLLAEADRAQAEVQLATGHPLAARDIAAAALDVAEAIGAKPLAGALTRVFAMAVAHGAPGDADRGGAREMFDRAAELLAEAGAELELGRTLMAYADFEASAGRDDAAWKMRSEARVIQERARHSNHPTPPLQPPAATSAG